jgi:hypothetical protein
MDEFKRKHGHDSHDKSETAALKVSSKMPFNCYYCKEEGHIKRECPVLRAKLNKMKGRAQS